MLSADRKHRDAGPRRRRLLRYELARRWEGEPPSPRAAPRSAGHAANLAPLPSRPASASAPPAAPRQGGSEQTSGFRSPPATSLSPAGARCPHRSADPAFLFGANPGPGREDRRAVAADRHHSPGRTRREPVQDSVTDGPTAAQLRPCEICAAVSSALWEFQRRFQYEIMVNRAAQRNLAADGGLCSFHTWQYEAKASPQGISEGYPPCAQ